MKIRTDFVTNSSSSSYVVITANDTNKTVLFECNDEGTSMKDINAIIAKLIDARERGATMIEIYQEGGYEG